MDAQQLVNLRVQLSALDSLDVPFVYFDNSAPLFLSGRGAEMLAIKDRDRVADYSEHFEPMRLLAQSLNTPSANRVASLSSDSGRSSIEELEIMMDGGLKLPVVAFARPFSVPLPNSEISGVLVVFYNLTYYQAFFRTIEQSRKNRALLILCSSYLGASLAVESMGHEHSRSYAEVEKKFFARVGKANENIFRTDLLEGITTAIDIVDPLILNSAKIMVEAKNSALLAISQPNFLRTVCHVLLEAADFIGPFGRIRVVASVSKRSADKKENEPAVRICVSAERENSSPSFTSPLELYFYRRYMPVHYKVTVNEDAEAKNNVLHIGAGAASVSEDSLTENLSIAAHLASRCGVGLQITRPASRILEILITPPLAE